MTNVYLPEVVERVLDVQLTGTPPKICCPFHDDPNPSFAIYDDQAHCYGCGWHGDAKKFLAQMGVPWAMVKEWLEGDYFTSVETDRTPKQVTDLTEEFRLAGYTRTSDARDRAAALVQGRWPHLVLDTLLGWGVSVGDYNLLVPHTDTGGRVIGVKSRSTLRARLGERSAFKHSTFTSRLYRVLDRPEATKVWLVEGESDTWSLSYHFQRDPNVAVYGMPSGVQAWKDDWAQELRGRTVQILFDNDDPGWGGMAHVSNRLFELGLVDTSSKPLLPARFKDVSEAYAGGWRP